MKQSKLIAFCGILFMLGSQYVLQAQPVCNVVANAGTDATVCTPGSPITLSGTTTGGQILGALWSPSSLLDNHLALFTTGTINATTTYDLSVTSLSPTNLITNGDFAVFDTLSFDSDYIYGTGGGVGLLSNEGQYALALNSGTTHTQFADCNDHGPGNNYMMVVNASGTASAVWCQTVTIEPNTNYVFGAWVTSVVSQNPAKLQFSANGTLLGNVFNASAATCNWTQFNANWNSGVATSVEICIRNVNFTPAGNDFALDDISLQKICVATDQVTITVANLNAAWTPPALGICQDEPTFDPNTFLAANATPGGVWTLDGNTVATINPSTLSTGSHTLKYTVTLGPCTQESSQNISVFAPVSAGQPVPTQEQCAGAGLVNLATMLVGATPGGVWTETSAVPSTGNAFNAAAGTFDPDNQAAGTYSFTYTVNGQGPCADDEAVVSMIIHPTPVADAGLDKTIDCTTPTADIGGGNTTAGLQYSWVGNGIIQSNGPMATVGAGGTFTLNVLDPNSGCTASDEVIISSNIAHLQVTLNLTQPTCDKPESGMIAVSTVNGGTTPYMYALNGAAFQTSPDFPALAPGNYTIAVTDAFGCDTTLNAVLNNPSTVMVSLAASDGSLNPEINLGDSIRLLAAVNLPADQIDSLIWQPAIAGCSNCDSPFVGPDTTTTYTVTAVDINGCTATAQLTVTVFIRRKIYVPNAFSPNGDGINDLFIVNVGAGVTHIHSLKIFNRWGALVYEGLDLPLSNSNIGWDGKQQGQKSSPGVYVYLLEAELLDGTIVKYSGEVALMR